MSDFSDVMATGMTTMLLPVVTAVLNLARKMGLRITANSNSPHGWYMCFLYHQPVVPQIRYQRRARTRPRPLLLIGGISGLRVLWSKDEEGRVPAYIKYQLLKAQRALREGNYDLAGKAYHRALRRLASSEYADSQAYIEARAVTLDKLANMYLEEGKLEEAEVTFKEAMKFMLTAGMEQESEAMVEISLKLSKIYTNQKKYELAETGFVWCVEIAEKLCSVSKTENNLALWGMCLHAKGQYHLSVGQWDSAISSLRHALELSKEVFNNSHLQVAVLHNDLATALDGSGEFSDAEYHARTSLEIMSDSRTADPDTEYLARVYYNLGMILTHQGKASEAKTVLTKALDKAIQLRDKSLQRLIKHTLRGL